MKSFFLVFLFIINTNLVWACSCRENTTQELFNNSDSVFIATATIDYKSEPGGGKSLLKIERVFKGLQSKVGQLVEVKTGGRGSCGIFFQKSLKYLVFGMNKVGNDSIWTTTCNGSGELQPRSQNIDELEKLISK